MIVGMMRVLAAICRSVEMNVRGETFGVFGESKGHVTMTIMVMEPQDGCEYNKRQQQKGCPML